MISAFISVVAGLFFLFYLNPLFQKINEREVITPSYK